MTLRLAFVGTGGIARIHARAAAKIPNVELAAAVNHRPESLAAFAAEFSIPDQYPDIRTLFARADVDAVVISTPNALHTPQAIAALEAGVHALVEKPLSVNANQAEAMVVAGGTSGALLMTAHVWRFDPEVRWLRGQVQEGVLGQIVRTTATAVQPFQGPTGWFVEKKWAGGGALADLGVHAIDTTRFILGDPEPDSVYARAGTHYGNYDVDDTAMLIINWQGGVSSYIEAGWRQPHSNGPSAATQVYGTQGYGQIFPAYVQRLTTAGDAGELVDPGFIRTQHVPQQVYDDQMAYFISCVLGHTLPVPGGMEGWVNMKILDAAYLSARTGKVIKVEPYTGGSL